MSHEEFSLGRPSLAPPCLAAQERWMGSGAEPRMDPLYTHRNEGRTNNENDNLRERAFGTRAMPEGTALPAYPDHRERKMEMKP